MVPELSPGEPAWYKVWYERCSAKEGMGVKTCPDTRTLLETIESVGLGSLSVFCRRWGCLCEGCLWIDQWDAALVGAISFSWLCPLCLRACWSSAASRPPAQSFW